MLSKTKFLLILLGLSCAVNVFFIGHTIGQQRTPENRENLHKPPLHFNMRKIGEYLTDQQKQALRRALRSKQPMLRDNYRAIKKIEEQIKTVLAAETVDTEKLRSLMKERQDKMQLGHEPMNMLLLDFLPNLDWETRKEISKGMFKRKKRKKRNRNHRPPPPHPDDRL